MCDSEIEYRRDQYHHQRLEDMVIAIVFGNAKVPSTDGLHALLTERSGADD